MLPAVLPTVHRPVSHSSQCVRSRSFTLCALHPETQSSPTTAPCRKHLPSNLGSQLSALQHLEVAPLQAAVSSEALDAMRRCVASVHHWHAADDKSSTAVVASALMRQ